MARSRNSAFLVAGVAFAFAAGLLLWRWLGATGEGDSKRETRPTLAQGPVTPSPSAPPAPPVTT